MSRYQCNSQEEVQVAMCVHVDNAYCRPKSPILPIRLLGKLKISLAAVDMVSEQVAYIAQDGLMTANRCLNKRACSYSLPATFLETHGTVQSIRSFVLGYDANRNRAGSSYE